MKDCAERMKARTGELPMCKLHLSGTCPFGNNCCFSHGRKAGNIRTADRAMKHDKDSDCYGFSNTRSDTDDFLQGEVDPNT